MPALNRETQQEIVNLLEPRMETLGERLAILRLAFANSPKILGNIRFEGSPRIFTSNLVYELINYGETSEGKQALWVVLEVIRDQVGINIQKQIDALYPDIELLSQKKPSYDVISQPVTYEQPPQQPRDTEEISVDLVEKKLPIIEKQKSLPKIKPAHKLPDNAEITPQDFFDRMLPIPPDNPRFYMAAILVSNGLYYRFVTSNHSWRLDEGEAAQKSADKNYLRHWRNGQPQDDELHLPVTNISICAAEAFAKWLSEMVGTDVRLPTFQEWDISVRAGRNNWFVEEIQAGRVNFFSTSSKLQAIDAFEANPFGIHDLLGNAYEICSATDGSTTPYLLAGGCFHSTQAELHANLDVPQNIQSKTTCIPHASFRCTYST